MNYSRRPDERRRRVMMTTGATTPSVVTASSRRRMEQLREAQRPQVAYGSRVRRCLRGRWFSLVPVHRSAFIKFLSVLALLVVVLVFLHDASVRYAVIADQPSWVDVLRINRYGSFGRYAIGVLYLLVAGASWLVYQLRRYRNDDFSGNYQLWQWIVASALVASIASAVPIVAMMGACIDWALGQRAALSGKDWIELFLMVGGAILALRTIAEMWRYRWSTGFMLGGWLAMAIPTAADWNIIDVEDLSRWTLVTSAPLIAVACWVSATVGYLRCLFREVRGIEPVPGLMQRLRVVADDWTSGSEDSEASDETTTNSSPPPIKRETVAKSVSTPPANRTDARERLDPELEGDNSEDSTRRSWWPFGGRKEVESDEDTDSTQTNTSLAEEISSSPTADSEDQTERKKRGWWPRLRRNPKDSSDNDDSDSDEARSQGSNESKSDDEADQPAAKKRRFGLGSIMQRRNNPDAEDSDNGNPSNEPAKTVARTNTTSDQTEDEDSGMSEDDVDWSSMNKAERRRMRKQLKRGGKAA